MRFRHSLQTVSLTILIAFAGLPFAGTTAHASGVIIYDSLDKVRPEHRPRIRNRPIEGWTPFGIKSEQIEVAIDDARSETTVEQVFVNRSGGPAEGTYLFPMAEDAAVHNFAMWMNGKEVQGELLDANKAREIYQSIVSKMRDPALLQYVGRGLFQAKVFPIPPNGECRIKLKYSQGHRRDAGLANYRFPLAAVGVSSQPIERLSLRASIRSDSPLTHIFSPSHSCSIDWQGEKEAIVGFERTGAPTDADFQLFFGSGAQEFGLALLTHRVPGEDGFFMARICPATGVKEEGVLAKNICFVLDTSGSMADDNKIAQAKKALKFCVTNLGEADYFNVIAFSTEVKTFREDWSPANEDCKSAARAFIDRLNAVGGTDIDGALTKAISMKPQHGRDLSHSGPFHKHFANNPYMIVFVTDGEPTVGVTDPQQILARAAEKNRDGAARVFVLGVGYQVNTKLLDRLADDNGGARDYVTPSEDLELKLSSFYTKLASPVLTGLKLAFKGLTVDSVYPLKLPDLFKGGELIVYGRYASSNRESNRVELSGTRRGEPVKYKYDGKFPGEHRCNDFLPRLWAIQKIGYLLDQLRMHGDNKELRDEVVQLSTRYGIMTPYTSFLVQEDQKIAWSGGRSAAPPMSRDVNLVLGTRGKAMDDAKRGFDGTAGEAPAKASQTINRMRNDHDAGADKELGDMVTFLNQSDGRRTMNQLRARTFYQDGARWVDSQYDGKAKTTQIVAFTPEYYDLAARRPEIAEYLAQGEQVVLVVDGKNYEIIQKAEKP